VFLRQNYSDEASYSSQPVSPPFEAHGTVTFVGASIGLQFDCRDGQFENRRPDPLNERLAGIALNLGVATIKDTLFLGIEEQPPKLKWKGFRFFGPDKREPTKRKPARVKGSLSLNGASVRVLVDDGFVGEGGIDKNGLAKDVRGEDGTKRSCHLNLDGFTYERIEGTASSKASLRKQWLKRQSPAHLSGDLRLQPFEQLVKVLRAMGYQNDANKIAMAKRHYLWKARPWSRIHVWLPELVFLDWFLGYGYRLARALGILLLIGMGYACFYEQAARQGAIVPAKAEILKEERFMKCHPPGGNWVECPGLEEVQVPFDGWLYSADVMLPLLDIGQKAAWRPVHHQSVVLYLPLLQNVTLPPGFVYSMQLLELGMGWFCGILVAAVVGFVKKE
jgi:hypothetical protein